MRITWETEFQDWRATSTLPLSHGDSLRNSQHCLYKVQQGRSNSEYPLMRTCISHKEYSQAMPRDRSRKTGVSLETPVRNGLWGPRKHPQMVTPLSKEGLGSWALQSNPIDLADNLLPTRFGWQHKSPWWYSDAKRERLSCHSLPWLWAQHTSLTH